ncbi:N-terminal acetyltransferase A complex auxiliary subunit NAA15-like [Humulus lupulus]|uniref:N-terminal acetyltransferase A complex auxiliary subunit NAA15-like n=1 Tax=Humulus lupulus TaxID=3486 RepID=UPI002B400704|nr:N-terminal acetyltransferase A complex auxiliary subunit NAA15-like [Humulus lupulus]
MVGQPRSLYFGGAFCSITALSCSIKKDLIIIRRLIFTRSQEKNPPVGLPSLSLSSLLCLPSLSSFLCLPLSTTSAQEECPGGGRLIPNINTKAKKYSSPKALSLSVQPRTRSKPSPPTDHPVSSHHRLPSTKFQVTSQSQRQPKVCAALTISSSKTGKRNVKPVDPDPHGEKLLQVEDPLLEATKYLKFLQKNSPDSLETHLLSFEVNVRKQKVLLAFQAVKQLLRLNAEHPDTHRCLIKCFHKVDSMPTPVTDVEKLISSVLEAERPIISILHEKSLIEANKIFLEKHKGDCQTCSVAATTELLYALQPDKKAEVVKLIEDATHNPAPR